MLASQPGAPKKPMQVQGQSVNFRKHIQDAEYLHSKRCVGEGRKERSKSAVERNKISLFLQVLTSVFIVPSLDSAGTQSQSIKHKI